MYQAAGEPALMAMLIRFPEAWPAWLNALAAMCALAALDLGGTFAAKEAVERRSLLFAGFGVTAFVGSDGGPVPMALIAATVNVYDEPLVNPVTVEVVDASGAEIVELRPTADNRPRLKQALTADFGE